MWNSKKIIQCSKLKKKLYLHKIVKANVFLVFCGIDSQVLVSTERKNTFYCQLVVIVHK